MQAYLVKSVYRLRKDIVVDGEFLTTVKIGSKLKFGSHEFLVKGITLGGSTIKRKEPSILLEPIPKIEDEKILLNQVLEIVINK